MAEYYYSADIGDGRVLCLAPLSDRNINLSGDDIDDPSGYYLFERHKSGDSEHVEILARVQNDDAISWLRSTFNMR